jgi:hypothetical protein
MNEPTKPHARAALSVSASLACHARLPRRRSSRRRCGGGRLLGARLLVTQQFDSAFGRCDLVFGRRRRTHAPVMSLASARPFHKKPLEQSESA